MSDFIFILVTGVASGALYGLVGLGIVITHRATGVLNMSMIAVATFAMYIVLELRGSIGLWPALTVGLVLSAVSGVVVREIFIRPLKGRDPFAGLVITIGLMLVVEHLIGKQWGFHAAQFPALASGSFRIGDNFVRFQDLLNIAVAAAAVLVVGYVFTRTALGAAMRAVAESGEKAGLLGINPHRIARISWMMSLVLVAIAATLLVAGGSLTPTVLGVVLFRALAGILLGGLTSMTGAVVGGVLIGVLDNLVASYLSASYRDTIIFAVAVAVLLVRPQGIFGEKSYARV